MSKSWDSSILKKLKALVGKGLSTSEIGKKLGMSKNAIVGKLHRLGWNAKATDAANVAKKPVAKKPAPTKKVAVKKPAEPKVVAKKTSAKLGKAVKPVKSVKSVDVVPNKTKTGGRAISGKSSGVHQCVIQHALEMANLRPNQCRWPIGDPDSDGFHFCGQPVFVGKPYCYEHCKQAYQFTPPKKK